jgi:hypothetical protein
LRNVKKDAGGWDKSFEFRLKRSRLDLECFLNLETLDLQGPLQTANSDLLKRVSERERTSPFPAILRNESK